MSLITYRTIDVNGLKVFYRELGPSDGPKLLLLLHGFPSASHMFRDLIPQLADRFHVVAPDLLGFGQSGMPSRDSFTYTFEALTDAIESFADAMGFNRYALYVFDYGAPTGFRLAVRRPERITAIITQNGNAYEEGLSDGWNPVRAYWREPTQANRDAIRSMLQPETTVWQYTHGVAEHPRSRRPFGGLARRLHARQPLPRPSGRGRDSAGPLSRLREQRRTLSRVPGVLPNPPGTAAGHLGPQRPVLPARRSRSLQA
jgi:pimeloyl-ACP methyl ester carboxylesterase